MVYRKSYSFLLFWMLATCLSAQAPLRSKTNYGPAEGLTHTVRQIAQDEDDFLWLATSKGLFRFDGVHATKVNYLPSDTLPETALDILTLSYDRKHRCLWLGTKSGIFRYHSHSGESFHWRAKDLFDEKEILSQASKTIFADRQGEVWANFGVRGLVHLQGDGRSATVYSLPLTEKEKSEGLSGDMANSIMSIAQDANSEQILWIATIRGLLRFDKSTKELQRNINYIKQAGMLLDANSFLNVFSHPNGFVYIGTWDAGLLKFDPTSKSYSHFLPAPQHFAKTANKNRVTKLIPAEKGNIWTACSGGSRLFDVEKEEFTTEYYPDFSIDFQDKEGNYWQIKDGLKLFHRFDNKLKRHFIPAFVQCENRSELPFDIMARQVFIRGKCQNGVWAMNVDDFAWKQYPLPGRAAEKVRLAGFCQTSDGFLVSDELHRIYFRPQNVDKFHLLPVSIPPDVGNMNIAARKDGHIFITGHEGWLFWLKPGSGQPQVYNQFNVNEPMPGYFSCVSSPTFDQLGRLWLRTCGGFSIFVPEEDRFLHFPLKTSKSIQLEAYSSFLLDTQNRMWTCGNGAIGWFDPVKPGEGLQQRFGPAEGYAFSEVGLAFFVKGKLWMHEKEGLTEFDPEHGSYRKFKNLHSNEHAAISLGNGDGMMLLDNAFCRFYLDSLEEFKEDPKPYITWFNVFEKPWHLTGDPFSPNKVILQPNENFISVGFSALSWHDPSTIRFAYQLEGLNENWVKLEPGTLTTSFTNLEGGDYLLKIKTTNSQGDWIENVYGLDIHVGTAWWKTWWLKVGSLVLLGGIVYFLVRNRLKQQEILLENQQLQLEKELSLRNERERIAAEMHDDLGAGLTTIRFLSLAAKEKEADPEKAVHMDRIAVHASQVMEKMADIIWVMNSLNDSLENFTAYLRRFAAEYLETHCLQFVMESSGSLEGRKLSGEQRRSLLLAIKECLHNVVKHADARTVRLTVKADDKMEVTVQDDGKGLSEELLLALQTAHNSLIGNGLRNISQRMSALGGEAIFENETGTKVRLRMGFAS